MHVAKAPVVGFLSPHGMGLATIGKELLVVILLIGGPKCGGIEHCAAGVVGVPGVIAKLVNVVAKAVGAHGPGAGGVFPLGFGGKAILFATPWR